MAEKEYIIIHETWAESAKRDAITFGTLSAVVLLGWLLDSSALQWIGGLAWVVWILARTSPAIDRVLYTVEEARERLDEIEAKISDGKRHV